MRRCQMLFALPMLAIVACSGGDKSAAGTADSTSASAATAPQAGGSPQDDMAAIAGYRLTMDKLDQHFAAQRNLMEAFKKMTPAEREAAKARMEGGDENTLDAMAAKYDRVAPVKDALADAGLTSREFTLMTMSLVQAGMAASVLKMRPNDDADSLAREMKASIENIRFLQQNEAEITRKQKELEAEMQAAGLT